MARRQGRKHSKEKLKHQLTAHDYEHILESFDFQKQDLETETYVGNVNINTEEIRGILAAIEDLCDTLDDLPVENEEVIK